MRIATAMAVACTSVVCLAAGTDAQALARQYQLNIPKQSLDTALRDLAQQTGLQIALFSDTINGSATVGPIVGTQSADAALKILLAPSGLSFKVVSERAIAIVNTKDAAPVTGARQGKPRLWDHIRLTQAETSAASVAQTDQGDRTNGNTVANNAHAALEEIVVTAQKREERLFDVPQSVTALRADELTRAGISQFRDYADSVPGLAYNTTGAGYTQIVLRGVTTGYETGAPVAIYVDEVPYGGSGANVNTTRQAFDAGLFDLDRVEVLRGPQGTLYGASAVGGLVKYVSKRPSADKFEGQAQIGLASTEQGGLTRSIAGAVNLPISEGKAGVRLSGFYNHDGGYIDNLALGKDDVNQADIYGGRADLLLTPTERFSVRLALYAQDISRDGESSADFTFAGSPIHSDMTQSRPAAEPFDQKFRLVSATLNYTFDWAELTSISSYQEDDTASVGDLTTLYAPFLAPLGETYSSIGFLNSPETDKFTQEIRLASASGERLEWILGGFYADEDSEYYSTFVSRDAAGQLVPDIISHGTAIPKYEEYAGFGTLTWHMTDKLDASAGIRHAKIHQTYSSHNVGVFAVPPLPEASADSDATTYLANARYVFSDRSMLYARYATGYRPGGPNSGYIDATTFQHVPIGPYDSDTLSSYEVGFRHETADRRFSMDFAAYYIDWKDIIIRVFDSATNANYYDNAAGMRVRGGELGLTARPVHSLTLTATMAYTDAYMTESNAQLGAGKGERMPTVPRFSGSATADYAFSDVRWQPTLGAAIRYTSDRNASFDGATSFRQYPMPAYTAVDVHAGLSFTPYDLQLYVRNVLNERGQVSAYTWQNPNAARVAMLQPRTIGLTVTTRF